METQRVVLELLPYGGRGASNRLSPNSINDAKLLIHEEIFQKYRDHKRAAYEKMEERLKGAAAEYQEKLTAGQPTLDNVKKVELPGKKNAAARKEKYDYFRSKWRHDVYDPIFTEYEQDRFRGKEYEPGRFFGTIAQGVTVESLLNDIKIKLKAMHPEMIMVYVPVGNVTVVSVADQFGQGAVLVARVYKQEARFKRIYKGKEDLPDVFEHRGNNRHYVLDRYGIFIPRFLIRNLSANDDELLKAGLRSRDGRTPNSNSAAFVDGVVRHLRAAQQGGSYFISTTSTSKHIYGSTGANFYSPQTGQVLIDAAVIPQDDLVDVHSPMAMATILGVEEYDWTLEFKEDDQSYQAMAAARDAIRTREIVVHGSIPNHAIARIRALNLGIMGWTTPCCYATHGIPTDPSINQRLPSFAK
ncbi:hypothetical protein [Granulicella mallensis]|uniref:Uncharacterized protein n=1 Tax=Granulicella mallensis TaxID=940614 RepID=A0A7W7ZT61_9BACT|nr:hypothetical protein [Granulicella mallensis]MBB5065338.1 hypothetical protein [Granulicella mallensis]